VGSLRDIREAHRQRVIDVVRDHGPISRAHLQAVTALSRTTVAAVVGELLSSGFAIELPAPPAANPARPGRPPMLLSLNAGAAGALGIDIGRHQIRVAVADLAWTVLAERVAELDDGRSADRTLEAVVRLAEEVLDASGLSRSRIVGAVVGLPGPVARGKVPAGSLLHDWAGVRATDELSLRLGVPVEIDNDANLAALGELAVGAAQGLEDIVYVRVSWGIGAGIVLGGRIHRGASGLAGEIGHINVEPDGRLCACGNRGCLGTVAALGPMLDLLRPVHGAGLTPADMRDLAIAGDPAVQRVIGDAGGEIGRVLAGLCHAINPSAIVVGGELASAGPALLEGIRGELQRSAVTLVFEPLSVTPGVLGERASLVGALATIIADRERLRSLGLFALADPPARAS
jgi:predicted NBD/HSP70 family sugar kinase